MTTRDERPRRACPSCTKANQLAGENCAWCDEYVGFDATEEVAARASGARWGRAERAAEEATERRREECAQDVLHILCRMNGERLTDRLVERSQAMSDFNWLTDYLANGDRDARAVVDRAARSVHSTNGRVGYRAWREEVERSADPAGDLPGSPHA